MNIHFSISRIGKFTYFYLIVRLLIFIFYSEIIKLLEKYEQMSNLISIEIEDLMSPLMTTKTLSKRKDDGEHLTRKRRKIEVEEEDKENTPVLAQRQVPIQQLTPPLTPPTRHIRKPIQNLSFTNIIFDHTHRISYSACLDMLQIFLG